MNSVVLHLFSSKFLRVVKMNLVVKALTTMSMDSAKLISLKSLSFVIYYCTLVDVIFPLLSPSPQELRIKSRDGGVCLS